MYFALPIIQGSLLTTAAAVYYTTPKSTATKITQLTVTNTDTVVRTVSLYLASSSASPTTADIVVKAKAIQPNETWVAYPLVGAILAADTTVQAEADAAGVVVIKASGIELS